MRVAPEIQLTPEEREVLVKLARSGRTSVRLAQRARIVLLAGKGMRNKDIAEELGVGRVQVGRWRERYAEFRLAGIERDLPRGAPARVVDDARLVNLTTQGMPPKATHWSTRSMARELGVSQSSISRHWRAHGLKPHLVETFKISRDPKFAEKLEDIVGLYMAPPEHALVLCCDEKSQIQALDRTQPGLPLKKGRAATIRTITSAMAPPRCSPRSIRWMARLSPGVSCATAIPNGWTSCDRSIGKPPTTNRCT